MYKIDCTILAKFVVDDKEAAIKAMKRMKKRIEILSPDIYADFYAHLMVIDEDGLPVATEGIDNESES